MYQNVNPALAGTLIYICLSTTFASAEPNGTSAAEGLVRDMITLVNAAEQRNWQIDRYEIEDLMNDALVCVCRASNDTREAGVRRLNEMIEKEGEDPREVWLAANKDEDAIAEIMTLTRSRRLLKVAAERATNDCPFFIETNGNYRERHRVTDRLFMAVQGGGLMNLRFSDEFRAGGGGSGRIDLGRGFGPNWSLRMGLEMGGAGLFDEKLDTNDIDLLFYFALPVTLRYRSRLWHRDVEIAPVTMGLPWQDERRYGGRVGGLFGLTYARLGIIQPWGGLKISAEYIPSQQGMDDSLTMRIGLRFGFDLHIDDD
ncbi:MAG: hypothetical protein ACON3Z_14680 [Bradymonadia bacterium]